MELDLETIVVGAADQLADSVEAAGEELELVKAAVTVGEIWALALVKAAVTVLEFEVDFEVGAVQMLVKPVRRASVHCSVQWNFEQFDESGDYCDYSDSPCFLLDHGLKSL